jgi:hypothetical protein
MNIVCISKQKINVDILLTMLFELPCSPISLLCVRPDRYQNEIYWGNGTAKTLLAPQLPRVFDTVDHLL